MLPTGETLVVFATATITVLILPGPSVVYVMTRGLEQGRAAGMLAMLGLETGALVHVVAATVGIAALLASSPTAFACVRYGGAAYLLYLAFRQLRTGYALASGSALRTERSRWRLYRDGVVVDLLNPKTSLFFIAFLPQFVDRSRGSADVQMLALGLCFVGLAALCDGTYALVSGGVGARLQRTERLHGRINWATSGVYVTLAGAALVH
ncbi:MAG: LysE family translocator [Nocardioidaceae bacterium]